MHATAGSAVRVRFALPDAALRPFVTTYYCTDVALGEEGAWLEDCLHPEWANLRFLRDCESFSAIGTEPMRQCPEFVVTGPTSRPAHFRISSGRSWGIGLLPLGWASLMRVRASDYADRLVDGRADPAFVPLAEALRTCSGGYPAELALIELHMARVFTEQLEADPAISAINDALIDSELETVADLAGRVGMNLRSLERLCKRAFGFPPKLLLRRQRFLRSLARFLLDPSLKWLSALDYQYHDQSHFVRDFKRFMGMSPSAYAKLDKPFLIAAARARMEIAGAAVQGLHEPGRGA
jgi:AraC-like DNA-binding protein